MQAKEVIYRLSIALACAILAMLLGGLLAYLITVFGFGKIVSDSLILILTVALFSSQLGIVVGLKLSSKLIKKKRAASKA